MFTHIIHRHSYNKLTRLSKEGKKMQEKRFAKTPLLYIDQPTISKPKAPMQHDYLTPRKVQKNTEQVETPKKRTPTRPQKRSYFYEEEQAFKQREKASELKDETGREREQTSTEKQFKNMTLQEKVNYFVELPDHIVKVRCEMITEDKKYRGIITDFKDDFVYIRIGQRSSSERIEFSKVKEIRMLGF